VAAAPEPVPSYQYDVSGVRTLAQRNSIARTGAAIDAVDGRVVTITATAQEARSVRRLGFKITQLPADSGGGTTTLDFPPADSRYHNFAEMTSEINTIVSGHSNIARQSVTARRTRGATSSPSRSATTSPPTRTSRRCCSPTTSTPAST
jgi:hypothetical protein